MEASHFANTAEVKAVFPSVDFPKGELAVFNIGRQYRLIVNIRFRWGHVFIRHVMTHDEYERRSREGTL